MNEDTLLKYLMRKCSPEELEQVNRWITANPSNAEWLFEMERIWSLKDELRFSDEQKIEKAYAEFLTRIDKGKKAATVPTRRSIGFRRYLRYAAAVIVIVGLAGVLYHTQKSASPSATTTVEVPTGQLASLTLSDGTKVWLNSQSKLTYPENFQKSDRIVKLEGEGYFEVTHNEASPFIVETSSVKVKVLGTKFNLRAYDETSSVTLREGKVKVSVDEISQEVLLNPDEQAVYMTGENRIEVAAVETDNVSAWINGTIIFDNTPFSEVLKTLSRHYGATFDTSTIPTDSMNLTLQLTNESLKETLKYISLATDIAYEITEHTQADGKTKTYHVRFSK